jgi:hypothetical protein
MTQNGKGLPDLVNTVVNRERQKFVSLAARILASQEGFCVTTWLIT